jgi:hypothetical protein
MGNFILSHRIEKSAQSSARQTAESMFKIIQFVFYRVPEQNKAKFLSRVRGKVVRLNPGTLSTKTLPPTAAIGQSIGLAKNLLYGLNPGFIQEVLVELVKLLATTPQKTTPLPPGAGA